MKENRQVVLDALFLDYRAAPAFRSWRGSSRVNLVLAPSSTSLIKADSC